MYFHRRTTKHSKIKYSYSILFSTEKKSIIMKRLKFYDKVFWLVIIDIWPLLYKLSVNKVTKKTLLAIPDCVDL